MAVHTKFSIKKKISYLLSGILLIALVSYAAISIAQFRSDKLKYIHDINKAFTATIAEKIQSTFDNTIRDIQNILTITHSGIVDDQKANLLKRIFQNNVSFVSFSLFRNGAKPEQTYGLYNKNYMSLYTIPDKALIELALDGMTAFKTQRRSEVDTLFYVNQRKYDILTFIFPLKADKNMTAVFNISKDSLHRAVAEATVHESFVVDGQGVVIAHRDIGMIGSSAAQHPLFQQALALPFKEASHVYSLSSTDESYIGNYFKLGNGLILLSQVNKTRAFRGMQQIIINSILFAIIILALSIITGMQFSRTLTAPLQKLMKVTENISAGNYNVRIDIKTHDEIAQLASHFVTLGQKLSKREAELEVATDLATKDGLTGLYNHRYFQNQLNEFFNLTKRHGHPLSLLIVDIDYFKKINDTYGHQQGDEVIKGLSRVLMAILRTTDVAARYGGEEFAVILPHTDREGAWQVAERIRIQFSEMRIRSGDVEMQATCSIGVATFTHNNLQTVDELIKRADQNLYLAKKKRNTVSAGLAAA